MADEAPNPDTPSSERDGPADALIERERDLLKIREEAARGIDVQAAAITAATLALVAVAAGSDVDGSGRDGWLVAAGVLVFLSALAGGIARLPAPPPLKALLLRREKERVLALYNPKPDARLRRLGRDLGAAIRLSEHDLRSLTLAAPSELLAESLLVHWRARNDLARYRMHSKSAWFTLSLVLLYVAVLIFAASTM